MRFKLKEHEALTGIDERKKMWIPSKLTRPGRLHNAIVRPRVLDLLQHATCYKLVLFRSPAGYGKTTMAAQWLADKPNLGGTALMIAITIRSAL